jgi:hypothetical protein
MVLPRNAEELDDSDVEHETARSRKRLGVNLFRVSGFAAAGAVLTAGATNALFGWPLWELRVERVLGIFVLLFTFLGAGMVVWTNNTFRGRLFEASVPLDVYRAEGLAGVEHLTRGLPKRSRRDTLNQLADQLRRLDDPAGEAAARRRAAELR